MSAAELRQAAETLRGRTEDANPGPWSPDGNAVRLGRLCLALTYGTERGDDADQKRKDALYIATMHPGVGLALADWLDMAGADWFAFGDEDHHRPEHEPCDYCDDDPYGPHLRSALTIARLINGGAS